MRYALLFLLAVAPCVAAQIPPVGIIDVYGLRTVPEDRVRAALQFREGESFPASKAEVERRLATIPGVVRARITGVCCDAGKAIVFVGIEEAGSSLPRFRPEPTGAVRLPDDIVQAGAAFMEAAKAAVLRGDAEEDQSSGHSLMRDSAARAIQERFIGFARRDGARLREVLRNSGDSTHRALAAEVLAYGSDKADAIRELTDAVLDPSSEVRNNAVRALALLAIYGKAHPELQLNVSPAPFIDMLSSPVWTDRNKSSLALMQITESRDSTLLAELRSRALPALAEMARWKSEAHAIPSLFILGRIGGLADDAINAAIARGNRQSIIDAAMKATPQRASQPTANPITETIKGFGYYGGWLVAAFDSIPANQYGFRPTPAQQTVGHIAQHLEDANYQLCARFGGRVRTITDRDSLPEAVKAAWPKDTLVARLRASLAFCGAAMQTLTDANLGDELPSTPVMRQAPRARWVLLFLTDLADHYSQIANYMRILGLVPPSALPGPGR